MTLPVNQTSDTGPSTVEDRTVVLRLSSTRRIASGRRTDGPRRVNDMMDRISVHPHAGIVFHVLRMSENVFRSSVLLPRPVTADGVVFGRLCS